MIDKENKPLVLIKPEAVCYNVVKYYGFRSRGSISLETEKNPIIAEIFTINQSNLCFSKTTNYVCVANIKINKLKLIYLYNFTLHKILSVKNNFSIKINSKFLL